ncbi:histone-lysine N-methyltransferase [Rubneribacter sp.]
MPKHASNEPRGASSGKNDFDSDERIGLTEAFPAVQPSDPKAGEDGRIGLTEAFAPVAAGEGAHAGGFSYQGDNDDEYPDAFESLEPVEAPPLLFDDAPAPEPKRTRGRHGKERKPPVPPHQRKSRRMRKILIAIVVLLVLLIGALGYFVWQWFQESQLVAAQQAQEQQSSQEVGSLQQDQSETKDASTTVSKKTEAPSLTSLLGMTKDQAIESLKRGATETSSKEVNEEGNPVKTNVTVALTDEPADTRSGTPTVYLGLNEEGAVVQAGYSAATASLGYGSLSFVDAVQNERIVEKTLQEAGVSVAEGSVELPADKSEYSEYASDGTTLVKESCSFSGTVEFNGAPHEWSSVLLYDYATANTSGNLADTVRIIYVYVNA